jgi:predicted Zn-dependent protease
VNRSRPRIVAALLVALLGLLVGAAVGCAAPGGILSGIWDELSGEPSGPSPEAALYASEGRLAEAVREVEIARRRRPDDPELLAQAADLYLRVDAPRRALAALEQATRLSPEDAALWERYAAVAELCRDVEGAYVGYRRVLALDEDRAPALAGFARTARSLGILDEAKRAERRLRKLPPVAAPPMASPWVGGSPTAAPPPAGGAAAP